MSTYEHDREEKNQDPGNWLSSLIETLKDYKKTQQRRTFNMFSSCQQETDTF